MATEGTSFGSVRLEVGGATLATWTQISIIRSLSDISGSFELAYDDRARLQASLPMWGEAERRDLMTLLPFQVFRLYLDDELVMLGRLDDVDFDVGEDVRARLTGRDMAGQLVDCSAAPEGPAEFRGLTVIEIATRLCAPFGIAVRADVDGGAPLPDYGLDVGETVLSAIDKAAKQRAILVTSDGVGGLLLTRSGSRRAPDGLSLPGNAISAGARLSGRERYSDYWVKGQARLSRHGRQAPLRSDVPPVFSRAPDGSTTSSHSRISAIPQDGTQYPRTVDAPAVTQATRERPSIVSTGHATDPQVPIYRPRVFVARHQGGGAPNQQLAEWRMRIARGRAVKNRWVVAGWRAGQDNRLWRPNETVALTVGGADPYDMLVESVHYQQGEQGSITEMHLVGREAYDLEPLPDTHRRHGKGARGSDVTRTGGGGGRDR